MTLPASNKATTARRRLELEGAITHIHALSLPLSAARQQAKNYAACVARVLRDLYERESMRKESFASVNSILEYYVEDRLWNLHGEQQCSRPVTRAREQHGYRR